MLSQCSTAVYVMQIQPRERQRLSIPKYTAGYHCIKASEILYLSPIMLGMYYKVALNSIE